MSEDRRAALEQQKAQLVAYARMKLDAGDQHGVADAAMDIREIDARLDELARVDPATLTLGAAVWGPYQAPLSPTAGGALTPQMLNPPPLPPSKPAPGSSAGEVTPVPQCDAVVMGGRCVMVEGHQGAHLNADEWRAEAH
jgi:hypothetical protein